MKRVKETFKSSEIAHVWANESAPYGRVSGGNMSFDGDRFNSYGTTIARIIHYKGKRAYVLDTATLSVTTSRHQNNVRRAISGAEKVFHVHCGRRGQSLEFTPQTLHDYYLAEFKDVGTPSKFAFKRAQAIDHRYHWLSVAREVCGYFGLNPNRIDKMLADFMPQVRTAQTLLGEREQKLEAAQAKRAVLRKQKDERHALSLFEQLKNGTLGNTYLPEGFVRIHLPSSLAVEFDRLIANRDREKDNRMD